VKDQVSVVFLLSSFSPPPVWSFIP